MKRFRAAPHYIEGKKALPEKLFDLVLLAGRLFRRCFPQNEGRIMPIVDKVIIGGWTTAIAMIGVCALHESGKLVQIRKRIASWLEAAAASIRPSAESLQPEREDAA